MPSKQPASASDRPDLAAMVVPLGRALLAAERPVLEAHGLTMWAYSVLIALEGQTVRTQSALADAIRADRTRIIGVLDDLQERGLINRSPDPADRRAHLLSLTTAGRGLRRRTQSAIRANEDLLLEQLAPTQRRAFLRALQRLAQASRSGRE